MVKDGRDMAALLAALPSSTLPPELTALRDLGAVINLAYHWPVVHVTKIPMRRTRLGIAALPAFAGVYVDAGFTSLAWLDATLPRALPLTLVVDPDVFGTLSAFAYVWGDCITDIIVSSEWEDPNPVSDLLGRCGNARTVTIKNATMRDAATYVAALPMRHVHTLSVSTLDEDDMGAFGIVAWLQGPSATVLTLGDAFVRDSTALASAILACTTLRLLSLTFAPGVEDDLVTSLSVLRSNLNDGDVLRLVKKLDRSKVDSFTFERADDGDNKERPDTDMLGALALCPALKTVHLNDVYIYGSSPIPTTDGWPQLSTFAMRHSTFKTPSNVVQLMQQLSTSRCLMDVDLSRTLLGEAGFVELAKALPAWMARGLIARCRARVG